VNSVNPAFGGAGEAEIARVTQRLMRAAGLETAVFSPPGAPDRPSVVGSLPPAGGGASAGGPQPLMLNAHYDTVGVDEMEAPFEPRIEGERLHGRGGYDMKGALAACIEAAAMLTDAGQRPPAGLVVAAVSDEENESLGTADLLRRRDLGELHFGAAIVTEPTSLKLCVAHRGFVWIEVTVHGRAAHGSRYLLGDDANIRMGRVLGELETLRDRLQSQAGHSLLGPPSLHAATVHGGTGLSTYSARCVLNIERRTVPPETVEGVESEIDRLLEGLRAEDPSLRTSRRTLFSREPFETSPDAPVVRCLRRAAKRVLGVAPEVTGDSPWMDSALTQAAGVDSVVMGPSGSGAHAEVEWVDIGSCVLLARVLAETALRW